MKPFPIPPQRGGTVQPEHVIGRSDIIAKLWKILKVAGFILFAERRFGKSSLIKKMAADSHKGFVTLYLQIESVNSGDALAEKILSKAKEDKLLPENNYNKLLSLLEKIPIRIKSAGSIEIEARKMIWQSKIKAIIEEILENYPDQKLVIFLDEFSLMLDKMPTEEAAQIVAYLRALTQDSLAEKLRFTYSGSVGVDLILDKIRNDGHQIGPVLNHMEAIELNAFDEDTTLFFCQCLELGTEITLTKDARSHIYQITDGIPFFIDRIFTNTIFEESEDITNEILDQTILDILTNRKKNETLDHFYDRIKHYYEEKDLAYALLDILSQKENHLISESDLKSSHGIPEKKDRIVMETINKLYKDNYLNRNIIDDERHFTFRYDLIRRWWKINNA